MAKKVGRKCKYYTHIEPYFEEIEKMLRTMTEQQIAEQLGVSYRSWSDYKTKFPQFTQMIIKSRQNLVSELRSKLIEKAMGYEYTETEKTCENGVLTKEVIKIKKAAPDVAALNLLLKNYDKENWANDPQMLALRKKELELREKQIEEGQWA